MNPMLIILSPVPEPSAESAEPAAPATAWQLPRRARVGVLSNGTPNTSPLLDGVLEVLAADERVAPAERARKDSASQPADRAILDRLAAGCDLVVGAAAD